MPSVVPLNKRRLLVMRKTVGKDEEKQSPKNEEKSPGG